MEALVYNWSGKRAWESVPDPTLKVPTDAIVRIDTATICGTDLHILKGDVPTVTPGTILGHEAVGTIEEVGAAVTSFVPGDRVLISCITSCGRCRFCKEARYGLCTGGGGWILGHLIDGVQAEYARIPFADTSAYKVPEPLTDEQVLFLADILPTAFEVGVLNGRREAGRRRRDRRRRPDRPRCGADGQAVHTGEDRRAGRCRQAARAGEELRRRRDDQQRHRGRSCSDHGADRWPRSRRGDRGGRRAGDVRALHELVRPGGTVANVGVHGHPATLHLEKLWIRGVTMTTGLVDTFSTPTLLKLIAEGRLDRTPFTTHRFKLSEAMEAYDVFGAAAETNALKVVLEGEKAPLEPKERLAAAVA